MLLENSCGAYGSIGAKGILRLRVIRLRRVTLRSGWQYV